MDTSPGPRGRTHGAGDVAIRTNDARFHQGVEVWGWDVLAALEAGVRVAEVVGEDDHDVRLVAPPGRVRGPARQGDAREGEGQRYQGEAAGPRFCAAHDEFLGNGTSERCLSRVVRAGA